MVQKLETIIADRLNSYVGLDISEKDKWTKYNQKFKFYVCDACKSEPFLKGKNLIFTQSAVEHFQNDLEFFRITKESIADQRCIQIHLLPSPFCLFTYLFHGYRTDCVV